MIKPHKSVDKKEAVKTKAKTKKPTKKPMRPEAEDDGPPTKAKKSAKKGKY